MSRQACAAGPGTGVPGKVPSTRRRGPRGHGVSGNRRPLGGFVGVSCGTAGKAIAAEETAGGIGLSAQSPSFRWMIVRGVAAYGVQVVPPNHKLGQIHTHQLKGAHDGKAQSKRTE